MSNFNHLLLCIYSAANWLPSIRRHFSMIKSYKDSPLQWKGPGCSLVPVWYLLTPGDESNNMACNSWSSTCPTFLCQCLCQGIAAKKLIKGQNAVLIPQLFVFLCLKHLTIQKISRLDKTCLNSAQLSFFSSKAVSLYIVLSGCRGWRL